MSPRSKLTFRPRLESAEHRVLMTAMAVAPALIASQAATVSAEDTNTFKIHVINKTGGSVQVRYEALVLNKVGRFEQVQDFKDLPAVTIGNGNGDSRKLTYNVSKGIAPEPYFVLKINNHPLGLSETKQVVKPARINAVTVTIRRDGRGRLESTVSY